MPEKNWNEVFALQEHYNLTDKQICFGLNLNDELFAAAAILRKEKGYFAPDGTIDFALWDEWAEGLTHVQDNSVIIEEDDVTIVENPEPVEKPKTPTTQKAKNPTAPKAKRGHKIKDAYEAIPAEKVPVEEFRARFDVSLSVLRRHKHFDHIPETGQVRVKKVKLPGDSEKTLCIWREKHETSIL